MLRFVTLLSTIGSQACECLNSTCAPRGIGASHTDSPPGFWYSPILSLTLKLPYPDLSGTLIPITILTLALTPTHVKGKITTMSTQSSKILAIDPGVHGAIAYVARDDRGKPVQICLQDVITRDHPYGKMVDVERMLSELDGIPEPDLVLFEEPFAVYSQPMYGRKTPQISTSSHTMKVSLVNFGRLQTVIEKITSIDNWYTVHPGVWKKAMNLTSNKQTSLIHARNSFELAQDLLKRTKDHDRAEALLLAEYAHWHLWQNSLVDSS